MGRWIWAYFIGCVCATPILFVGGILSFGAEAYLDADDGAVVLGAVFVLLAVSLAFCLAMGALPTLVTHFAVRGAERTDPTSYIVAGLVLWGIMGLAIGAIAEPSDSIGRMRDEGEVDLLGWTITSALSGGVAMALYWFLGVNPQPTHGRPMNRGGQPPHDDTLLLTSAQIYEPQQHMPAPVQQHYPAAHYYEPPRRQDPHHYDAPHHHESHQPVTPAPPAITYEPQPLYAEHSEQPYTQLEPAPVQSPFRPAAQPALRPAPYVPVQPVDPVPESRSETKKGFGFFSRRGKKTRPAYHDPAIPFI